MTQLPPKSDGGNKIVAISAIFMTFSILAVGLRVFAARIRGRVFRSHDYFAFAALIFALGFGVNTIIGVYLGGSGQHVQQIIINPNEGLETINRGLKNFFASAFIWACASCLCKLSVLCLYIELFPKRGFRYAVYIMFGVVAAFWTGLILTGFLICRPIAYNWDKTLRGECGSTMDEEIAFAVFNMVIDGMIVVLPMPTIWGLQMPVKTKISICCIFGLGFTICVMNAARIGCAVTANEADYSYALINVAIFSGLEIWFGIIATCAPTLKPLFSSSVNSRNESPSDGYRNQRYKRSHTGTLGSSQTGASWELERTFQKKQGDKFSGTRFKRLNDDNLPLNGGLAFLGEMPRTETTASTRTQREESLSIGNDNMHADNVQVQTEITVSSSLSPGI